MVSFVSDPLLDGHIRLAGAISVTSLPMSPTRRLYCPGDISSTWDWLQEVWDIWDMLKHNSAPVLSTLFLKDLEHMSMCFFGVPWYFNVTATRVLQAARSPIGLCDGWCGRDPRSQISPFVHVSQVQKFTANSIKFGQASAHMFRLYKFCPVFHSQIPWVCKKAHKHVPAGCVCNLMKGNAPQDTCRFIS